MRAMCRADMRAAGGFTLIEAVVTIVIAAILSIGIINYIGDSVEGFASSANRNQLSSSGRTVIDRMALELNNAVPNSHRVTSPGAGGDQCLEFLPFEAVGSYLDAPTTGAGDDTFDAVALQPAIELTSPAAGYHAVLYPNSTADIYDVDLGAAPRQGPVAVLDALSAPFAATVPDTGTLQTLTLAAVHRFPRRSPLERVFITRQPVSFCVVQNRIYRYESYGFSEQQCSPGAAPPADCLPESAATGRHLVTDNIDNAGLTAFTVLPPALRRNAVISLELNFTDSGDTVRLKHDVLSRNVP